MSENLLQFSRPEATPLPGASIVSTAPRSVTLTVFGEVDTFGAPVLDAALDVVWGDDPRDVVVDLTNVTFLSVSGLHALLRTRRMAQRRGADLSLRTNSRQIARLLDFAGVSDVASARGRSRGGWDPSPGEQLTGRGGGGDKPRRRGVLGLAPERAAQRDIDTSNADDALLRTVRGGAAWCSAETLQSSLSSVCATAVANIPGAEGAGIVLTDADHHGIESRAGTDGRASALDAVRELLRCPPGPDQEPDPAWIDGAVVVDELGEDPRWPALAARAEELDVRSVLCLSIGATRPLGALTVYSSRPDAFPGEAQRLGRILAAVATVSLSAAQRHRHLARALTTRDVIGQAKGILMERHKITAEQAFLVLTRASSLRNVKLGLLAEQVAGTGSL